MDFWQNQTKLCGSCKLALCSRLIPILGAFVAFFSASLYHVLNHVMDVFDIYQPSNLLSTQEPVSKYRPGGFHPVHLGDTFKGGRYTNTTSWAGVAFPPSGLQRTKSMPL